MDLSINTMVKTLREHHQDNIANYLLQLKDKEIIQSLLWHLDKIDFDLMDSVYQNLCVAPSKDLQYYSQMRPLQNMKMLDKISLTEADDYNKRGYQLISRGEGMSQLYCKSVSSCSLVGKVPGQVSPTLRECTILGFLVINPSFRYFVKDCLASSTPYAYINRNLVKSKLGQCKPIPLYIMTCQANDQVTKQFFTENEYFGLDWDQITFYYNSDEFPLLTLDGKLILQDDRSVMAGNGNGTFITSLHSTGHLRNMKSKGIKYMQLLSVDNVLQKLADPLWLGYVDCNQLYFSSKFVRKVKAGERVGIHCEIEGKPLIVEYTEIPEHLEKSTDDNGNLLFCHGNICQTLASIDYLCEIVHDHQAFMVEHAKHYHVGKKRNNYFCPDNRIIVQPNAPNSYRFELYYFDVFPLCPASKFGVFEASREDEFAPVKNPPGSAEDGPDQARELWYNRDRKWLRQNGLKTTDRTEVEISPLLTYFGENINCDQYKGKALPKQLVLLHPTELEKYDYLNQNLCESPINLNFIEEPPAKEHQRPQEQTPPYILQQFSSVPQHSPEPPSLYFSQYQPFNQTPYYQPLPQYAPIKRSFSPTVQPLYPRSQPGTQRLHQVQDQQPVRMVYGTATRVQPFGPKRQIQAPPQRTSNYVPRFSNYGGRGAPQIPRMLSQGAVGLQQQGHFNTSQVGLQHVASIGGIHYQNPAIIHPPLANQTYQKIAQPAFSNGPPRFAQMYRR